MIGTHYSGTEIRHFKLKMNEYKSGLYECKPLACNFIPDCKRCNYNL